MTLAGTGARVAGWQQRDSTETFRAARDLLLTHRDDYERAVTEFRWPDLTHFNFGFDWFDVLAAEQPDVPALWIVHGDGTEDQLTYAELSARSSQLAAWLRAEGVDRGDRVLLVLGNVAPLWEVMLACIKLGVVVIPATTLLGPARPGRPGRARPGPARRRPRRPTPTSSPTSPATGPGSRSVPRSPGWLRYDDSFEHLETFTAEVETKADETLLLYFTSGTTARPKLVEHTHTSYPVGHLSTAYWIGLQPGDVHLNVSSPGWAKHAWSNVFAPWIAGATAFVVNQPRFDAAALLDTMARCGVTTFCAPPTVWRMLVQEDLRGAPGAVAARGRRRRRAAEPRGDRAGAAGLGHDGPRRLRPDRDHRADRQPAGRAAQARLDGPAAARATPSRCSTRSPPRPAPRARSASTCRPGRPR